MRFKIPLVLGLFSGIMCSWGFGGAAWAASPIPFPSNPFIARESFGCKYLMIPGSELLPTRSSIPGAFPGDRRSR